MGIEKDNIHDNGLEKDRALLHYMGYSLSDSLSKDKFDLTGKFIYIYSWPSKKSDILTVLGDRQQVENTIYYMELDEAIADIKRLEAIGYYLTSPDQEGLQTINNEQYAHIGSFSGESLKEKTLIMTSDEVKFFTNIVRKHNNITDDDSSGIEAQDAITESFKYPNMFPTVRQSIDFLRSVGYTVDDYNSNKNFYDVHGYIPYVFFSIGNELHDEFFDATGIDLQNGELYAFGSNDDFERAYSQFKAKTKAKEDHSNFNTQKVFHYHSDKQDLLVFNNNPKQETYVAWGSGKVRDFADRYAGSHSIDRPDSDGISVTGLLTERFEYPATFDRFEDALGFLRALGFDIKQGSSPEIYSFIGPACYVSSRDRSEKLCSFLLKTTGIKLEPFDQYVFGSKEDMNKACDMMKAGSNLLEDDSIIGVRILYQQVAPSKMIGFIDPILKGGKKSSFLMVDPKKIIDIANRVIGANELGKEDASGILAMGSLLESKKKRIQVLSHALQFLKTFGIECYEVITNNPSDIYRLCVQTPYITFCSSSAQMEVCEKMKIDPIDLVDNKYLFINIHEMYEFKKRFKNLGYDIIDSDEDSSSEDKMDYMYANKRDPNGKTVSIIANIWHDGGKDSGHDVKWRGVVDYADRLARSLDIKDDDISGINAIGALSESETGVHNIKSIDQAVRFLEHTGYKITPNTLSYQITGKFSYIGFDDMKDINVQNLLDFIGLDKNQVWNSRYFFTSDREVQQVHDILEKDYKVLKIGVQGWRSDISLKSDRPNRIAYIYGSFSNETFTWSDEHVIQYARRLCTELNIADDDFAGIDTIGSITESETIPMFDAWLKTANK